VTANANLTPPISQTENGGSRWRTFLVVAMAAEIAYGDFSTFEAMSTADQQAKPSFRLPSDGSLARFAVGVLGGLPVHWRRFRGQSSPSGAALSAGTSDSSAPLQLLTITVLAAIAPARAVELDGLKFVLPALLGAYCRLRVFDMLSTAQFRRTVALLLLGVWRGAVWESLLTHE
jgi:hypothetical protein